MTAETILALDGVPLPVGVARGIVESLSLIAAGELVRDVNGNLIDLTNPLLRKYRLDLSCTDQAAPVFDHLYPGDAVTVDAIGTIAQAVSPASATATLIRDPVSQADVIGVTAAGAELAAQSLDGRAVTFATAVTAVRFRPRLAMILVGRDRQHDEWSATTGWNLALEES